MNKRISCPRCGNEHTRVCYECCLCGYPYAEKRVPEITRLQERLALATEYRTEGFTIAHHWHSTLKGDHWHIQVDSSGIREKPGVSELILGEYNTADEAFDALEQWKKTE